MPEERKATRRRMSKSVRFEVFKRDSFRCQYCGKSAPDVVLHVDHIKPVAKGGKNDILNLITSCLECNLGKGAVELSDSSALAKQRRQLEELNQRREQLQMLVEWRDGLRSIEDQQLAVLADAFTEATGGWRLSDSALAKARKLMSSFGLSAVLEAIDIARAQYLRPGADGEVDRGSAEVAWKKIGGICVMRSKPEWERELYFIRGILRKRMRWVDEVGVMRLLRSAHANGVDLHHMRGLAVDCHTYSAFEEAILEAMG